MTTTLEAKVAKLWTSDDAELAKSLKILRIIFGNILQKPKEQKFRKVKKEKTLPKLTAHGAVDILLEAGFLNESACYVLPMDSSTEKVQAALNAIAAEELRRILKMDEPKPAQGKNSGSSASSTSTSSSSDSSPVVEIADVPLPTQGRRGTLNMRARKSIVGRVAGITAPLPEEKQTKEKVNWEKWGVDEVAAWLKKEGFGKYSKYFIEFGVEGEDLEIIEDSELKEDLFVTDAGDRKRILQKIQELIKANPPVAADLYDDHQDQPKKGSEKAPQTKKPEKEKEKAREKEKKDDVSETVSKWSVGQLKEFLKEKNVEYLDCVEKVDLVARAVEYMKKQNK